MFRFRLIKHLLNTHWYVPGRVTYIFTCSYMYTASPFVLLFFAKTFVLGSHSTRRNSSEGQAVSQLAIREWSKGGVTENYFSRSGGHLSSALRKPSARHSLKMRQREPQMMPSVRERQKKDVVREKGKDEKRCGWKFPIRF